MQVALRELKSGLSGFIARAQQGEVIEVTSHRRPVARIVGLPPQASAPLSALLADGSIRWTGGKPVFEPLLQATPHQRSVSDLVGEDRG